MGTPLRIIDLLDSGRLFMSFPISDDHLFIKLDALHLSALKRIIVDTSHIDQKKRGIFDMRDTQEPLMRLLTRPEIQSRYGDGKDGIQLLLY